MNADVVFYAMSWIDETWVRSTVLACRDRGLNCILATGGPADDASRAALENRGCRVIDQADSATLARIDAKVVVSASSGVPVDFFPPHFAVRIHMPHSLVSLHMIYPADSFDSFDSLFAAGPHHVREFEALSATRGLRGRRTFEVGYGKADLLPNLQSDVASAGRSVLIAPSWGPNALLPRLGYALVDTLLARGCNVVLRPHPLLVLNSDPSLSRIISAFGTHADFAFEHPETPPASMSTADVLVTDYSGTAFEYALIRHRPTVFVDVPRKEINPDWAKLDLEPIEIGFRDRIGVIATAEASAAADAVIHVLGQPAEAWRAHIAAAIPAFVFRAKGCGDTAANMLAGIVASQRQGARQ